MDLFLLKHAAPVRVDAVENVPCSLIVHQPPRDFILHFDDHSINLLLEILLKITVNEILDATRLDSIFYMLSHHLAVADHRVLRFGGNLLNAKALSHESLIHAHVLDQIEGLQLGGECSETILVVPQLVHEHVAHVAELLVAVLLFRPTLVENTKHPRMLVRVTYHVPHNRVPQRMHMRPTFPLPLEKGTRVPLAQDNLAHKDLDNFQKLVVGANFHEPLLDRIRYPHSPSLLRLLDPAPHPVLHGSQCLWSQH
mmetsp:Transcript_33467/g.78457  ORF Transcript_33467/g.78457 Transcript_33467/m.78457 type:complete len:254 (-) Transcript_33467:816-1577(-)